MSNISLHIYLMKYIYNIFFIIQLSMVPCCGYWKQWCNEHGVKEVISFPSDKYPEMELLEHMVFLFLIFWGTSILFSTVAVPIYIPTKRAQVFPFLHILTNNCYFLSFFFNHLFSPIFFSVSFMGSFSTWVFNPFFLFRHATWHVGS